MATPRKADYPGNVIALLQGQFGALEDSRLELFGRVLRSWGADLGQKVVARCLETCQRQPTLETLQRLAVDIESPRPSWSDACAEIIYLAERGVASERPGFSHPLVADTVVGLGGWADVVMAVRGFRDGSTNRQTWRAQLRDVYQGKEAHYVQQAAGFLSTPIDDRPAILFPDYTPFAHPESPFSGPRAALTRREVEQLRLQEAEGRARLALPAAPAEGSDVSERPAFTPEPGTITAADCRGALRRIIRETRQTIKLRDMPAARPDDYGHAPLVPLSREERARLTDEVAAHAARAAAIAHDDAAGGE